MVNLINGLDFHGCEACTAGRKAVGCDWNLITFDDRSGELALSVTSPDCWVDCTITCASPLKTLRFQLSGAVTILTVGVLPAPPCPPWPTDTRKVFSSIADSRTTVILSKADIQRPMQFVLHAPVIPHRHPDPLGCSGWQTADEVPSFRADLITNLSSRLYHGDAL